VSADGRRTPARPLAGRDGRSRARARLYPPGQPRHSRNEYTGIAGQRNTKLGAQRFLANVAGSPTRSRSMLVIGVRVHT
jgi:hypothetical protein